MEGAGGDIGKSLNHVDDEFERTAGKITKKLKDEVPPLENYPTYEEAMNTQFKNSKFPPSEKMYNENIDVYNNPKYFDQKTGDVIYPGMNGDSNINGFVDGKFDKVKIERGTVIDRYGDNMGGKFFSPAGETFESRALPPFMKEKPYEKFQVIKSFDSKIGRIAPWFDQIGNGTQIYTDYKILSRNGSLVDATVQNLLDNGYIRKVK